MANITLSDVKSRPYSAKGRENFDKIFPQSKRDFEKDGFVYQDLLSLEKELDARN